MSHRLLLGSLQYFRRQLHTPAFKPDPPVSTAIQAFCRDGQIHNAINLFAEIPHKNIFSYSAMIHGYAINGYYLDSLSLFRRMQHSQIRPNTYTVVAVLLASAGLNNPILAGCIHGITAKIGIESDSFVTTALLSSYSKCRATAEAYRLFGETENPGIASWNAMIAGFANNQRFDEGFSLFERLRKADVKPNCITMVIVAQICTNCCWASLETCESIHGYVVKIGLESDLGLMNSVLDMYTSFNSSNMAEIFFKNMKTRDAITWTNMMGFMLKLNRPTESLQLFSQLTACGINGDSITLINVISACTLSMDLAKGKTVHTRIITLGFGSEIQISNALITMYSRCGCVDPAMMIFNQIPNKTLISWTAMMFGYTYNNKPKDSINLFINLIREKQQQPFINLDPITLISPLLSSTNLSNLQLSKQLHSFIFKSGFLPQSILLQNTLIAAYGRSGEPDLAASIFNQMIRKDVVSWNAMISSYGINGEGEAALRVFQQMDRSGDSITFVNVLSACSHSGMVTEGLKVFEKMVKEERIRARGEHYGCVADLLSRGGRLEEVRKLGEAVTGELGLSVWKAVLGGSGIESDLGMAEVAAEKVFGMVVGEEGGGGHVALLANVYAAVGRFEWAEGLRDGGMGKKMKKKIGFSRVDGFVEEED